MAFALFSLSSRSPSGHSSFTRSHSGSNSLLLGNGRRGSYRRRGAMSRVNDTSRIPQ
jgi:hypothetical protein